MEERLRHAQTTFTEEEFLELHQFTAENRVKLKDLLRIAVLKFIRPVNLNAIEKGDISNG